MLFDGEPLAFGDTILVPFPFTNQESSKRRPAVVLSKESYAEDRPDVVLMAITSQLHTSQAYGEHWIEAWEEAGLIKPSAIKPVIATIEQSLILRRLGKLGSKDKAALWEMLQRLLG